MCNLCSSDEGTKQAAVAAALMHAEQLEALANAYRHMAYGKINPHTEKAKHIGNLARLVVRVLVDEWV